MKTITALGIASLVAISALPTVSKAEDNPLSFNVSLTSDYRYRGISQTRLKPALQGGADYALPGGFYVGTWLSTIKWIKDAGKFSTPPIDTGNANVEWDLYGGYKGEIQKDFTYDVGVLAYVYPGNHYARLTAGGKSANTTEIYGALTYGPATLKYSHTVTPLFGFAAAGVGNSKNSGYLDLSAGFDVGGGVTVTPHIGRQKITNFGAYSYTDYSLTVAKDWEGFTFSGAIVGADTKSVPGNLNNLAYPSPGGKDLGKASLVVAAKKTF